ncbi:unnamed protein product [Rotaria socialis]|uniref:Claudin n=1 Tax=Rotaria socialis TaxID=392032 RepID=A0A817Z7T4_9BILA|nr:unnamed protein product [Rotaria socialis]CAF3386601.1 unnamed protein product [Rotaria socialis]CAF3575443.1 unnamed protein product [Rotaria socialis]CAF4187568.1 unnamed protein product [Rotaria socialis]CAF4346561.1 unnamed protein product [Rotaria socialis]
MASVRPILVIVSGCIMILTFILYVVSNALPEWGVSESQSEKATIGLWRACISINGPTQCGYIISDCKLYRGQAIQRCHKMMAARVFVTIACILSALSAVCIFTYIIIKTDANQIIFMISKVLPILSFIAGAIGLAVGIAFITPSDSIKLSSATFVDIVAVAINVIGAILTVLIR